MARTRTYRVLPTGPFLAAINANSPSDTNPFATMADLFAGTNIPKVATASLLPPPATVPNQLYYVTTAVGAKWRKTLYGGTWEPAGLYYSNGVIWDTTDVPFQASQVDVDAGVVTEQFVSPKTLFDYFKWGTKVDNRTTTLQTGVYLVTNSTRNVECDGTFIVTLPLLATITHYENIDITNNGTGIITVNTSGGEFLGDASYAQTTIDLYPGESLTIAKGDTTYIVK